MKLLLHPGLGKTATSWLQQVALPAMAVPSVWKSNGKSVDHYYPDSEVLRHQKALFNPVFSAREMLKRHRNPFAELESLAEISAERLIRILRSRDFRSDVGVLSEENTLHYGGPDINLGALAGVINLLSQILQADLQREVTTEVVVTIREQSSYLRSFYAYDAAHQKQSFKTFESFIDAIVENPSSGPASQLLYDDFFRYLRAGLPPQTTLRFVPYEILLLHGPAAFVQEFLGPDVPLSKSDLSTLDKNPRNAQNSSGYRERVLGKRASALREVRGVVPDKLAATLMRSEFLRSLRQRATRELRAGKPVSYSAARAKDVREIYSEQNRKLDARVTVSLSELGYNIS